MNRITELEYEIYFEDWNVLRKEHEKNMIFSLLVPLK